MKWKTWLELAIVFIVCFSVTLQALEFWRFKNQGLRFTYNDGKELCEKIQAIEAKIGSIPGPCKFTSSKKENH